LFGVYVGIISPWLGLTSATRTARSAARLSLAQNHLGGFAAPGATIGNTCSCVAIGAWISLAPVLAALPAQDLGHRWGRPLAQEAVRQRDEVRRAYSGANVRGRRTASALLMTTPVSGCSDYLTFARSSAAVANS
jgi:hypothetical protein